MNPQEPQTVDNDAFVASVASTVAVLNNLAAAAQSIGDRFEYFPRAESAAMAEIAREKAIGAGKEPAHEAHNAGGMLATLGTDHMQAYAHLFAAPPIPVFAHYSVARGAIEAYAWAYWILRPDIDVVTRVKRAFLLRLKDGLQRKRLPMQEMKDKGREIIADIRAIASGVGWQVFCNDDQVVVDQEHLPSPRVVIADILPSQDGKEGGLWGVSSGVLHASLYAIVMNMELVEDRPAPAATVAALVTTSTTVHLLGMVLARACITACGAKFRLSGWEGDDEWRKAVDGAEAHIAALLAALDVGRGPVTQS